MADKGNLLIDFSSPVVKESCKPLIPMPCIKGNLMLSPTNDNPFDIVATQSEICIQNDPFELVFQKALNEKCIIKIDAPQDKSISENNYDIPNGKDTSNSSVKEQCVNKSNESFTKDQCPGLLSIVGSEGDISKVSIGDCSSIRSDDSNINEANFNPEDDIENKENKSQNLGDFSSEEGLKAVIATRVNKCIEKVLNNTGVKTTDDINESNTIHYFSAGPKHYRRSLSTSVVKKEFIHKLNNNNRSFAGGIFVLQSDEKLFPKKPFKSTSSSSCSSGGFNRGFLASRLSSDPCSPLECLHNNSDVFLPNNDDVFKEATKLANTFSEMANNRPQNNGQKEDENDLMSCKPDCLYTDSSEDEAELLKKDPSLNFHSNIAKLGLSKSFTADEVSKEDSEALSRFKNRSQDSEPEVKSNAPQQPPLLRSNSWNAPAPKKFQKPRLPVAVPVALVNPEEGSLKSIRVKKAIVEPTRRGPLKAVVPVQNMTKSVDPKKDRPKVESRRASIKSTQHLNVKNATPVTPVKKNKGMKQPIAASTPNRQSFVSPVPVKTSQRKSLDTQTRPTLLKRPQSANSSFQGRTATTPVLQVIQTGNKKLSDKNKSVGAVTDKAMKTSAKLMSKLKLGIGRNQVTKDKENRLPV